jgi:hypothetical protein
MTRIDVTVPLVRRLAEEAQPLVAKLTGWQLDLPDLAVRALPRDRGYEEVILHRLQGVGLSVDKDAPRGLFERIVEYVVEHSVAAAYEPSTGELSVIRENVDDSNLDGLRLVVAHELVHRGQHLQHPELFERVDSVIRESFEYISDGGTDLGMIMEKVSQVQSIMTILESHAVFVQEVLRETRFPDAVIESHFSLAAVLLRFFAGAKVAQYRDGIPQVAEATRRGKIDRMYADLAGE